QNPNTNPKPKGQTYTRAQRQEYKWIIYQAKKKQAREQAQRKLDAEVIHNLSKKVKLTPQERRLLSSSKKFIPLRKFAPNKLEVQLQEELSKMLHRVQGDITRSINKEQRHPKNPASTPPNEMYTPTLQDKIDL